VSSSSAEIDAIVQRYERREALGRNDRYSPLSPYTMMAEQEIDRAVARIFSRNGIADKVSRCSLLEIGCGSGRNLLRFLRLGFCPNKLVGNDLLPQRLNAAQRVLPGSLRLIPGDASAINLGDELFDIVSLFTVFSSILDDTFQAQLANKAWSLVKPGGGLLWYDFAYNNPANHDVRGVPVRRIRELFPEGVARCHRVTLAPPLGRPLAGLHPAFYVLANATWLLRSHVLAWIAKPAEK
jgi:SAM-dependent methyltransferase